MGSNHLNLIKLIKQILLNFHFNDSFYEKKANQDFRFFPKFWHAHLVTNIWQPGLNLKSAAARCLPKCDQALDTTFFKWLVFILKLLLMFQNCVRYLTKCLKFMDLKDFLKFEVVLISNSLEDIKMSKFQSTEFCCCSSTFFPKPRCLCVHESSRTSAVSGLCYQIS